MVFNPQNVVLDSDMFDQFQARFPASKTPDPSSPIATGIVALERRASNRSNINHLNKPGSPFERSRTESPSPRPSNLTLDIGAGIRSTASSPGPLSGSRRAPPPPMIKTKMRPPSELFLPSPTSARKSGFRFSTVLSEEGATMVGIKSNVAVEAAIAISVSPSSAPPLSPISASIADAIKRLDVGTSIQNAIDNLSVPDSNRFIFAPVRSSTAPPASLRRQTSFLSIKSTRSLPLRALSTRSGRLSRAVGGSSRGAGVRPQLSPKKRASQFSGIDKDVSADRRASAILAKHKSDMNNILPSPVDELPTRPVLRKAVTSVIPWRKKPRGETMSMLIDSGFFPIREFIYDKDSPTRSTTSPSKRSQLALNILVKDLPVERPSSILMTPKELYPSGPTTLKRSTRATHRRSIGVRRRILNAASVSSSQVSSTTEIQRSVTLTLPSPTSPTTPLTPSKALSALTGSTLLPPSPGSEGSIGQPSPGILEVIPEDHSTTVPTQAPPVPEAPAPPEPIESEIHLSSGTILTVSPPEMTAWRRSVYIQGPIKLPTPAVVPRKGGIATLEPFQDSLENAPIPRRKSEDGSADDVCDWYDSWEFDEVSFAFDEFKFDDADLISEWALAPLLEEPESPVDRTFSFPAPAPPLAKEVAAAMLGDSIANPGEQPAKPKPLSMVLVPLPELPKTPPIVAGSVTRHSRNSSGETSYKSATSEPIVRTDSRGSGMSGMSSVSSVEEQAWPEVKEGGKRRGSMEGLLKAKPKMSRMRRFVQTASAIL